MKVIVAGGGIGGLALAQGLFRRGVEVQVVERDVDAAATGGYRLHLSPAACAVLERELPASTWAALVGAASPPDAFRAMHVTDRRLRVLGTVAAGEGRHLLVGRIVLRRALAAGLGSSLTWGEQVTGWVADGSGVVVRCASGRQGRADLLVAADGVGSVVAGQAAGRPTSERIGLVGLAGRTSGLDPHDAGAPSFFARGPALAVGTGGAGMFITRHEPRAGQTDATTLGSTALHEPPTWVWGLVLAQPAGDARRPDVGSALRRMQGWSGWARGLVESTHPDELGTYRFHAGDPRTAFDDWGGAGVTALGDAVHAMPPTGGQSASTAIEDAGDLLQAIDRVRDGACSMPEALAHYRRRVVDRAGPRVRESLTPARWVVRSQGPLGSVALTTVGAVLRATRAVTGRATR